MFNSAPDENEGCSSRSSIWKFIKPQEISREHNGVSTHAILQYERMNDTFGSFLSSPTLLYVFFWHPSSAVANAIYNHCAISSLALSVRGDWRGPADTHTSPSQLHKCRHTSASTCTQKPVGVQRAGTHVQADSPGCGQPIDLGLRARYCEKGNNFMLKCIKEEYTGNKSKHFFHPDRLQQLPSPL